MALDRYYYYTREAVHPPICNINGYMVFTGGSKCPTSLFSFSGDGITVKLWVPQLCGYYPERFYKMKLDCVPK